jgi:hypothetical protein
MASSRTLTHGTYPRVFTALEALVEGARVLHDGRGPGYITQVELNDPRGKPYRVAYDSGEVHSYSMLSAAKLQVHHDDEANGERRPVKALSVTVLSPREEDAHDDGLEDEPSAVPSIPHSSRVEHLKSAFKLLDTNGDGYLSASELMQVLDLRCRCAGSVGFRPYARLARLSLTNA